MSSKRITLKELGSKLGIEVTDLTPKAIKEVDTPFGYKVKVGGLTNTGSKLNR